MSTHSNYIGIDFGTTNSSMAWYNPKTSQAEIIKNGEGEDKTPSLVLFGNEIVVGKEAEDSLNDASEDAAQREDVFRRTIMSIKRNLIAPPQIALPGNRYVRPEEVTAEILKKLKRDAEEGHFHEKVSKAAITFPAEFNYLQQQRIQEAGRLAGFEEVVLLEEPVAGALAYAKAGLDVGRHVLVYDLGGGTFDLALLENEENEEGSFRVAREPQGIDRCGGDDFDLALYYHFEKLAQEKLGQPLSLSAPDKKILRLCRRRKESLSYRESVTLSIRLPSGNEPPREFKHNLDRETFDALIRDLVDPTIQLTDKLVKEASVESRPVDTVVLIGGSTRVPLVQQRLKETLPAKPLQWDKQDVAVALGAAYHASRVWRDRVSSPPPPPPLKVPDVRGKTFDEAEQIVGTNLRLAVGDRQRSDEPAGFIISQDPPPGDQAEQGSPISVVLSDGPDDIEVPDLVGLSALEARNVLAAADLRLSDPSEDRSNDVPKGKIIEQEPVAGIMAARGTSVSVTVSLGHNSITLNLTAHGGSVWSVAASSDGRFLASGGDDRTIRLWDVSTGELLRTLTGHSGPVRSVALSPDGRFLASGGDDRAVRLWDVSTGEALRNLAGHARPVRSVAVSPDGRFLASGGDDRTIRLWDSGTGVTLNTLRNPGWWVLGRVRSVAIKFDGKLLASGDSAGKIGLWSVSTGELLRTLTGHSGPVRSVALSPDGRFLASGGDDRAVRLWDVSTGEALRNLAGHARPVRSVAVSPDGRFLASGGDDRTVRLWDVSTGELLRALAGHSGRVLSVAISPGGLLFSGDSSGVIRIWHDEVVEDARVPDKPQDLSG